MLTFQSKIILFGEYALLKGAMGLALPFPKFKGKLVKPENKDITSEQQLSNAVIVSLVEWITQHSFQYICNIERLKQDLAQGMYFECNIPQGYGLGSSGALVAALYTKYFQVVEFPKLKSVKEDLAILESFFHGKSSGTDPLVSFLNLPVCLNATRQIGKFNIPNNLQVFLINTGKPSHTKGLVQIFIEKSDKEPQLLQEFLHLNNQCIHEFLQNSAEVFETIQKFCLIEQRFLPEMFPNKNILSDIEKEMGSKLCIKLCGSGGGGYLLGFANKISIDELEKHFSKKSIQIIPINNHLSNHSQIVLI